MWRQSLLFGANFSASPYNGATLVGVTTSPWVDSILVDVLGDEYVWEDGDEELLDLDEDLTISVTAFSNCSGPVDFTESLLVEGVSGFSDLSPKWSVYPNPVYGELNVDFPGSDGLVVLRTLKDKPSCAETWIPGQFNGRCPDFLLVTMWWRFKPTVGWSAGN